MAHPKRKQSKSRRNKRRSHDSLTQPNIATCPTTGQPHLYHQAHVYEGKMYYKGKVIVEME
jgi:large subunit ribosomal protein L32